MSTEVLNPRADYLAANPKEAKNQAAALAAIGKSVTDIRELYEKVTKDFFTKNYRKFWSAGVLVNEFVERLPGKKLTADFYRQMVKDLKDSKGRPMKYGFLNWLAEWARRFPDGEIETFNINKMWRDLPLFMHGEQMKLLPETEGKGKAPYNPYDFFMELPARCAKEERELTESIEKFQSNPQFGPLPSLKNDRSDLYVEVKKQFETALGAREKEVEILKRALEQLG